MGLRISTNVTALKGQRNLTTSTENQATSLEKLSSGSRINRAGDDAAGLAISEKLKGSMRSINQAKRNASDGVSLVQTAEGGLNEVGNILIRLRELSVQSASDTIGAEERQYSNFEFQALTSEIDRISQVTEFNGAKLLSGVGETYDFQVGIRNNPEQDRLAYSPQATDVTIGKLGLSESNVASKESAQMNLEKIDAAISRVNENRAGLGALQNRLQSTIRNLGIQNESLSEANSRVRDTDFAAESSELTKQSILNQAGTAVLSQANSVQMNALKLI
jgi:flagellin